MSGFVDQFLHIGRQIAREAHPVRCDRMNEPELCCMKRLPFESQSLQDWSNR